MLREVSKELQIDPAILSKIERSERIGTKEQIIRLAELLDIDKKTLLIRFLSEKILQHIRDEEYGYQALKETERIVAYNKKG